MKKQSPAQPQHAIAMIKNHNNVKYSAPSLNKALDILEFLATTTKPLGLTDIAIQLRKSVGEIYRIMVVLEKRHYIKFEKNSGYSLHKKPLSIKSTKLKRENFIENALPLMQNFSSKTGHLCALEILSGTEVVTVACTKNTGRYDLSIKLGRRQPVMQSSAGAALLAVFDGHALNNVIDQLRACSSVRSIEHFIEKIEQIKTEKFYSRKLSIPDIQEIATPIANSINEYAALSTLYFPNGSTHSPYEQTISALIEASVLIGENDDPHEIMYCN